MSVRKNSEIRSSRISIIAFLLILEPGQALLAQEAHVHGVATLNAVREGKVVQIEFISPAANLLGFERMPDTYAEWTLLADVIEKIETSAWLLGDSLADCEMSIKALELPSFSTADGGHADDHGDNHQHDDHSEDSMSEAHVDFRVQYLFVCSNALPSQLRTTAFQLFPGIQRITVQWIIEGTAGFTELTAAAPIMPFE